MWLNRAIVAKWFLVLLGFATACNLLPKVEQKDTTISGLVAAENGQPIANAVVDAKQLGIQVKSDSKGYYTLVVPASKKIDRLGLQVKADGYAQHVAHLQLDANKQIDRGFLLRPIDLRQEVVLPTAGQPPVVVTLQQAESNMALEIGDNVLVDKAGNVITGTIEVSFTGFNAVQDRNVFPAQLLARNNNAPAGEPIPLVTYGMADIELRQAGALLQVAPGKTLLWQVQLPPLLQGVMQSYPQWHAPPAIFYLDEQSGLWVEDGNQQTGALNYAQEQGIFRAALPHLTTWNIDGSLLAHGGCVMGTVRDCSGNTLPNEEIGVWLLSWENLSVFRTRSDGSGRYCVNVGTSNVNLDPTPYVITNNNLETDMCNPMHPSCSACPGSGFANCNVSDSSCTPAFARCDVRSPSTSYFPYSCAFGREYGVTNGDCSIAINQMGIADCGLKCNPNVLRLTECSFCPGQQPAACVNNNNSLPITNNCAVADVRLPCRCAQPTQRCDPNIRDSCCNNLPCLGGFCGGPTGLCITEKAPESPCDPNEEGGEEMACCSPNLRCYDRLCLPR